MLLLVSQQQLCSSPGAFFPFVAGYPSEPYLASELQEPGSKMSTGLIPQVPVELGAAVLGGWKHACLGRYWQQASPVKHCNAGGPPCHSSHPMLCHQPSLFNQAFYQSALGSKHRPEEQIMHANVF